MAGWPPGDFDTDGTDLSDGNSGGTNVLSPALHHERGKWFLRLDVFGDDGFAVAVVEPEARRYTLTLLQNEQKRPYSAYSGYSGNSDCSG